MNIPPGVLEASNGVLWLVIFFCFCGAAFQLARAIKRVGSFVEVYYDEKACIALLFMFGGLFVRLANVWWMQHSHNHGAYTSWTWTGTSFPTTVHIVATFFAVIGAMCWLRVTLPQFLGWTGWAALITFSVLVSIYLAL